MNRAIMSNEQELLRQQGALARFGELALRSEDLDEILTEACCLVGEALGTDLAKVLELQEDGRTLLVKAGVGWKPGIVGQVRIEAEESSSEGHALRTNEPVICNDRQHETRFHFPGFLIDNGVQAMVNVVIIGGKDKAPYGVLEVDSRTPQRFGDTDIAFLRTYANLLAAAVDRLRVLDGVRRSEAFARSILEASPDCVKLLDADGTLRFMNDRGRQLHEIADTEQVFGRSYPDMWPAAKRDEVRLAIARAATGELTEITGFAPNASGTPHWWQARFAPSPTAGDGPVQVVGITRNITEQHEAQEALRDSQERLQAIFEATPVGILVAEAPSGRIVTTNGYAERVFRHPVISTPDIESYRNWVSFHADGRRVQATDYPLARALAGEDHPELEVHYQFDDGSRGWILLTAAPIRGPYGSITGAIVTALDIELQKRAATLLQQSNLSLEAQVQERTQALTASNRSLVAEMGGRQAAESQVRQLQKMEAVGQLTGGIAHDFNNMLAVVISGLTLVQRRLANGRTDVDKLIEAALDGAARAGKLTQRLLAFSRQQALAPEPVDANRLVAGMSDLLHRTLGEAVQVETVLAADLWLTHADTVQLENAVLNLAVNARDAMPEGGWLTIETGNTRLDEAYARENEDVAAGQYVLLSVSDTGTGMLPAVIGRVFDPFFTTKEVGRGTGLGLSQVYGFVKQSGGHIKIYSEPGRGTSVKIYLPRFYGEASVEQRARRSVDLIPGSREQVVLVVEDEDRVRDVTVAALRELGYTIIHADGAAAALRQLDAHPEVSLLFTDVVMPGISGSALAEEALRRRPDLRILFTTGYSRDAVVHGGVLGPNAQLLPKPFSLEQLAYKVREVFDAG